MGYWIAYIVILLAGLGLFSVPFWLFRRGGRRPGRGQALVENGSLALLALFLVLLLLELYFKLFFAQSDGFRYTLASRNWYQRYWRVNSLGYRDVEWTADKVAGKTRVMVVGDSFVAGSGIANPADRFSDRLGRLLGDGYVVFNVASPGWDTIDEVEAILSYPYQPDILVLSYYVNDIEGVAYSSGAQRPQIRQEPPAWLGPLVQNSYAANFVYWRLVRLGPQAWADIYWNDWLKQISSDPDIRWRHRQELETIILGAAAEQVPLYVVMFPNLAAIEESRPLLQPALDLFLEHGVPVLDVGQLLAGRDPAAITVNALDSHPNEAVNAEVAEHLYRLLAPTP